MRKQNSSNVSYRIEIPGSVRIRKRLPGRRFNNVRQWAAGVAVSAYPLSANRGYVETNLSLPGGYASFNVPPLR